MERDANAFEYSSEPFTLHYRDVSLNRLYGVLHTYCLLYTDYAFIVYRRSKYYELLFHAEPSLGVCE